MENLIYYFYKYNIETATTEINLPGWQKLTQEEIEVFINNDYKNIVNKNGVYSFNSFDEEFDLEQYKRIKIEYLSGESFIRAEQIIPDYKYTNCLISRNLVERGEDPIYPNYNEIMIAYENSRINSRNEFYRCKELVDLAITKEEIDNIIFEI